MLCRFLYFEFKVQMQSSVAAHVCCQVWPYGVPAVMDSLTGDHSIRLFVLKKGLVGHHQAGHPFDLTLKVKASTFTVRPIRSMVLIPYYEPISNLLILPSYMAQ